MLDLERVLEDDIVVDDATAEVVVVLLLEVVVLVETVKVCAATFNCEVKVKPNGESTPPPLETETIAAWQATGKSTCSGSWLSRTYPNFPDVTTGD